LIKSLKKPSKIQGKKIDETILDNKQHYFKEKLENFINVNKSMLSIVKHLRQYGKDDEIMTEFILVKCAYFHLSSLHEILNYDTYPSELLTPSFKDVWTLFIQTQVHKQIKEKLKVLVNDGVGKILESIFQKVQEKPVDMLSSFMKKAMTKDIKQNFSGVFTMIIHDEIAQFNEKIKSPSTGIAVKEILSRLLLDLQYALFVEEYIRNYKVGINYEGFESDRNRLLASEIDKAIKSESFFKKYLVEYNLTVKFH